MLAGFSYMGLRFEVVWIVYLFMLVRLLFVLYCFTWILCIDCVCCVCCLLVCCAVDLFVVLPAGCLPIDLTSLFNVCGFCYALIVLRD